MVWERVLEEPRFIDIHPWKDKGKIPPWDLVYADISHLTSGDYPPPITGVCSESRAIALRRYTRAFIEGTTPRYTYVNFDIDIIIMYDAIADMLHPTGKDRHSIQNLVLWTGPSISSPSFFPPYSQRAGSAVNMQNLKNFTLVASHWPDENENAADYEPQLRKIFQEAPKRSENWIIPRVRCVGRGDEEKVQFNLSDYMEHLDREASYCEEMDVGS